MISSSQQFYCLDAKKEGISGETIKILTSDAFYNEQEFTYETQRILRHYDRFIKELESHPYNASCGLTLPEYSRHKRNELFMTLNGPLESVHSFEDYHITNEEDGNDVLVRLYKHDIEPSSDLIIYIHGGGWTQGNLKNYAYLCRKLTKILEKDVLAVDYRLSPENPHPQQLNDIMAVYKYFLKSKYKKIYLSGDSGGGHLCASTCIKINDEGLKRPHGSILFYPALDNDFNSRSFKAFNCPALTKKGTMDYTNNLVGGNCLDPKNFSNKYIFPSLQKDMKVFPREILVSSGYDILFDGQLKHVKNMLKSGRKDLTWLVYPGVVHGFMNYGKFYDKLVTQVCQTVKKFLK